MISEASVKTSQSNFDSFTWFFSQLQTGKDPPWAGIKIPLLSSRTYVHQLACSQKHAVANLYIIDQSLRISGGHHLDYARCIALAGQEQGFATTLGAHRSFSPEIWQAATASAGTEDSTIIRPVFRETVYQADSYLAGLQKTTRSNSINALSLPTKSSWLKQLKHNFNRLLHRRRRTRIAQRFAAGCDAFFAEVDFKKDDQVFLTGVSELELDGLATFLATNQATTKAKWHLQFHFNLFDGRPDEYPAQKPIANAISASVLSSLKRLTYHSVDFYTTSSTLATQYNSLGVADFVSLPYPIATEYRQKHRQAQSQQRDFANSNRTSNSNRAASEAKPLQTNPTNQQPEQVLPFPVKQPSNSDPSRSKSQLGVEPPLRLVCAGGIRREKGQQNYLQTLVDDLWSSHLANGKIKLIVQRAAPKWPSTHKVDLQTPDAKESFNDVQLAQTADQRDSPIEYAQHPLPNDEYADLIRSTDIGLLFYDGRTYYSRRAGILGELLACGKPVIVSSGSWLSDQLEEANFSYADRVVNSHEIGRVLTVEQLDWKRSNVPLSGGVVSFDQGKHCFEFNVYPDNQESVAAISFAWHWPKTPGIYCHIEVEQFDDSGQALTTSKRVVGVRQRRRNLNVLFNLCPQASRVCFTLKNAFAKSSATIHQLSVTTLLGTDDATSRQPIPVGVVGLAAADTQDVACCVAEIESNYQHYAQSAKNFSVGWNANHDPALTIEYLIDREYSFRRVA